MKPILMVWANAHAAASARHVAVAGATHFLDFIVPLLFYCSYLLPGAVVDRVLEGRARLHQAPAQGPLVGMVEAFAGVGLGRRVEDARNLQVFGLEQPSRLLAAVA